MHAGMAARAEQNYSAERSRGNVGGTKGTQVTRLKRKPLVDVQNMRGSRGLFLVYLFAAGCAMSTPSGNHQDTLDCSRVL